MLVISRQSQKAQKQVEAAKGGTAEAKLGHGRMKLVTTKLARVKEKWCRIWGGTEVHKGCVMHV